jgi:hypothetical protein
MISLGKPKPVVLPSERYVSAAPRHLRLKTGSSTEVHCQLLAALSRAATKVMPLRAH